MTCWTTIVKSTDQIDVSDPSDELVQHVESQSAVVCTLPYVNPNRRISDYSIPFVFLNFLRFLFAWRPCLLQPKLFFGSQYFPTRKMRTKYRAFRMRMSHPPFCFRTLGISQINRCEIPFLDVLKPTVHQTTFGCK